MAGNPTKYPINDAEKQRQLFEALVTHMSKGYSFETFGVSDEFKKVLGYHVHRDTLYEWAKVHEVFSDTKKMAFSHCQMFWEGKGIDYLVEVKTEHEEETSRGMMRTTTVTEKLNNTVWIFNMKNRFGWTDRMQTSLSPGDGVKKFKMSYELEKDERSA